jgi:chromosome segregation ATPase
MLNLNSVEQKLRKYVERPANNWSEDCECKTKVSAVVDLLAKFNTTGKDANNSTPEATSDRSNKVDSEIQTEAICRQSDCAKNTDQQASVRRLKDEKGKLSVQLEGLERKIAQLNEEMDSMTREQSSHIHRIRWYEEENSAFLRKMRDMREEIICLKERRQPSTGVTEHHQPSESSHNTARRDAEETSDNRSQRRNNPDFRRKRNLPPRLQNRNLPPRLKKRNLPPRLQQAPFTDGRG